MSARGYMWLGFFVGVMTAGIEVSGLIPVTVMAFAGGAIFGKGYGIWEERHG